MLNLSLLTESRLSTAAPFSIKNDNDNHLTKKQHILVLMKKAILKTAKI